MLLEVSGPVRDVLVATLRHRVVRVRFSLEIGIGRLDFVGRLEGDFDELARWRLHAVVDGAPPDDDGVELRLDLERFDACHVENGVAVFVAGANRLEIAPLTA